MHLLLHYYLNLCILTLLMKEYSLIRKLKIGTTLKLSHLLAINVSKKFSKTTFVSDNRTTTV